MILAIFAHYDPDDIFDPFAYYYVEQLRTVVDQVIIVSTSSLSRNDKNHLQNMGCTVITRENKGYDFYSYKIGIQSVNINDYDALLLCNDSVYGPFFSLKNLIHGIEKKDLWGSTDS